MFLILYSFLGASVGAGLVFGIGSLAKGGVTPVRLVLARAAVSALLVALSEGIALYFRIGQDLAFWYAGGVGGPIGCNLKLCFRGRGCNYRRGDSLPIGNVA
jgi:iron complex transport system permease protein